MHFSFNKVIVVLTSDATLGAVLRDLLHPYGFDITVLSTRDTKYIDAIHVDVYILDLSSSVERGFAILDAMRIECPNLLGRTLVLSDLAEDLSPLLGDVIVLQKPVGVTELLDVVGLLSVYTIKCELGASWPRSGAFSYVRVSETLTVPIDSTNTKTYRTHSRRTAKLLTENDQRRRSRSAGINEMRKLLIHGDVQGNGYRFFATGLAMELGLTGWVQNLPNGAVQACVEGDKALIDIWIEKLRNGSRYARVTQIEQEVEAFTGEFREFEVRL